MGLISRVSSRTYRDFMSIECKIRIGNGHLSRGSVAIKTANSGKKYLKFVNTSSNFLGEFSDATEVKGRFIEAGRLTFNFKAHTPPMVVFLEGSTLQKLNGLLRKIRSSASVSTKTKTSQQIVRGTQERLVINVIERVPVVFPKTLKWLSITGVRDGRLSARLRHLKNLPNLHYLDLSDNDLDSLPSSCHTLALHTLNLSKNKIAAYRFTVDAAASATPTSALARKIGALEIQNLTTMKRSQLSMNLISLDLSENLIKEWDSSIVKLEKLKSLYLRSNRLKTLPGYISRLEHLEVLHLQKNLIKIVHREALKKNGYNRKFKELMLEENFCFQALTNATNAPSKVLFNQQLRRPRLEDIAFTAYTKKLAQSKFRRRTPNEIMRTLQTRTLVSQWYQDLDLFWTCQKCSKLQYGYSRARTKTEMHLPAGDFTAQLVAANHERFLKVFGYECC